MDDLYKILRALLSIKIPQSFASIIKDVVSASFDLFSSVSVRVDNSNMEDDGVSSKSRPLEGVGYIYSGTFLFATLDRCWDQNLQYKVVCIRPPH